jgi:hypothetical protein
MVNRFRCIAPEFIDQPRDFERRPPMLIGSKRSGSQIRAHDAINSTHRGVLA